MSAARAVLILALLWGSCLSLVGCGQREQGTAPSEGAQRPALSGDAPETAAAQTKAEVPAKAPLDGAPRETPAGEALSDEVRQILANLVHVYRNAETYQDECQFIVRIGFAGGSTQDRPADMSMAYARPNKLMLHTSGVQVYSDGQTRTVFLEPLGQYVTEPAPEQLGGNIFGDALPGFGNSMQAAPLRAALLFADDPWEKIMDSVERVERLDDEAIWGRACYVLKFDQNLMDATLYIDQESFLARQLTIDASATISPEDAAEQVTSLQYVINVKGAQIDAPVADARFAFSPPDGADEVATFDLGGGAAPARSALLGKAAPDFTLTSFGGDEITLSESQGKVTVVDFWATWCGPCRQELPILEEIWQQYKDKEVRFLALSVDDPSMAQEEIQQSLDELGVTFTALHDSEETLGRQYQVSGIPTLVLVDKQGVVQSVHVGLSPTLRSDLPAELDKLLAGESLVDEPPAEVRRE
jgi:thiol-disulfide isomerase/thioredoxin